MTKAFERGDIVVVNFEPVVGREIKGVHRPALVLSEARFNRFGLTYVAPITQGGNFARMAGFTVSLSGAGTATQGVALIGETTPLDLVARKAKLIERAPDFVVQDALAKLLPIFGE